MRVTTALGTLLAITLNGPALAADVEKFTIAVTYETQTKGKNSSSSSRGRTVYSEHILSTNGDCTIKRFDIVDDDGRERPLAVWQWPVEIELCGEGTRRIRNLPAMEARLASFLEAAEISRNACGSHYFTWNAFKVECDPQAILPIIDDIDLGSLSLVEGAEYAYSERQHATTLTKVSSEDGRSTLETEFDIDQTRFREETARTQVIVQELIGEPVSYEQALADAQAIKVSGSTVIEFKVATDMSEITQTVVTTATVNEPGEGRETRNSKVTTHRKRAAH